RRRELVDRGAVGPVDVHPVQRRGQAGDLELPARSRGLIARVDVDRVEGTGGGLGQEREARNAHARLAGQGQRRLYLAGHLVLGVGVGGAVPAHQHHDDHEQRDPRPPAPPPARPGHRSLITLSGRESLVIGIALSRRGTLVSLVRRIVLILPVALARREPRTGLVPLAGGVALAGLEPRGRRLVLLLG